MPDRPVDSDIFWTFLGHFKYPKNVYKMSKTCLMVTLRSRKCPGGPGDICPNLENVLGGAGDISRQSDNSQGGRRGHCPQFRKCPGRRLGGIRSKTASARASIPPLGGRRPTAPHLRSEIRRPDPWTGPRAPLLRKGPMGPLSLLCFVDFGRTRQS